MKEVLLNVAAILTAVVGLGMVASQNAPERSCPTRRNPPPQVAVIFRDEAAEALERAHKVNKNLKRKYH